MTRRDAPGWKPDQARQARAHLHGNVVELRNVRNTRYGPPTSRYEVAWETRSFDLGALRRLWFLVEPFHPTIPAIAHTFVSFEFEDDFLALSIEARVPEGRRYSIVRGLFGAFQLAYAFGDERDFILRRTRHLGHEVYLYPLVTPPLELRALFLTMLASANRLIERPRAYHSVRANCTTVLRNHANAVRPGSFPPFQLADVLPGRSDLLLYRKGWIDTTAPEAELREAHAIRDRAAAAADDPSFSRRIRAR